MSAFWVVEVEQEKRMWESNRHVEPSCLLEPRVGAKTRQFHSCSKPDTHPGCDNPAANGMGEATYKDRVQEKEKKSR